MQSRELHFAFFELRLVVFLFFVHSHFSLFHRLGSLFNRPQALLLSALEFPFPCTVLILPWSSYLLLALFNHLAELLFELVVVKKKLHEGLIINAHQGFMAYTQGSWDVIGYPHVLSQIFV
jgi:hypothetical protein